jgi:hypothetical protein
MRPASAQYLQEELRLRGARSRVRAVLHPFWLDYGLGPESGIFEHTRYGGEPGKLEMEEGPFLFGSWTSPVMQAFSPCLDRVVPTWETAAHGMSVSVFLRGAAEAAQVAGATFIPLSPGKEAPLDPYFQVRVEFRSTTRCWAPDTLEEADGLTAIGVDWSGDPESDSFTGEEAFLGVIQGLRLKGLLSLPEAEILDPGEIRLELARDFSGLKTSSHRLKLDNRRSQWLPPNNKFYLVLLSQEEKLLDLYHGFTLPDGQVEWLPLYEGVLFRVGELADGWQERHRAVLETRDWISHRLNQRLGAPTPEGERRPFMRGFYRARAELVEVTPAQITNPVKVGRGSATLRVLGTFRGDHDLTFLCQAETTGEVGTATFRWSTTGGQSWQETGLIATGPEAPVYLSQGLSVYWESGLGEDLISGDQFTFTAKAPRYRYRVFGAPFAAITTVYLNDEATWEGVVANPETGDLLVVGRSAQVSARVKKDNTTHPVDIIEDLLIEVGLGGAIHRDSFALARTLTPEYHIGVCFENVPASQALREILQRTLFDLWVDFGEIKIRAYLG